MILKKFFRNILIWKIVYSVLFFSSLLLFFQYIDNYKSDADYYKALYFSSFENIESMTLVYNDLFEDYNNLVEDYNFLVEKANFTTLEPSKARTNFSIEPDGIRVFFNNNFFKSSFTNTGSMRPMIGENTTCFFERINFSMLSIGDVIAFSRFDNVSVSHRIVELDEDFIGVYAITKGDNNLNRDSYLVRESDLIGVLVACIY